MDAAAAPTTTATATANDGRHGDCDIGNDDADDEIERWLMMTDG